MFILDPLSSDESANNRSIVARSNDFVFKSQPQATKQLPKQSLQRQHATLNGADVSQKLIAQVK